MEQRQGIILGASKPMIERILSLNRSPRLDDNSINRKFKSDKACDESAGGGIPPPYPSHRYIENGCPREKSDMRIAN